ncbi:Uncharacterized protein HZ326_17252 [Fusarium oxysporum f. sp. albedinis]|nr:Uncharacterized protein HZ326_17252 [Fusarium oxysporum f. sp. albedinis]
MTEQVMGDVGVCRCLTSAEGLVKNHGGEWKGNRQRRCLTSVKGGVPRVTRTIDNDKESARDQEHMIGQSLLLHLQSRHPPGFCRICLI